MPPLPPPFPNSFFRMLADSEPASIHVGGAAGAAAVVAEGEEEEEEEEDLSPLQGKKSEGDTAPPTPHTLLSRIFFLPDPNGAPVLHLLSVSLSLSLPLPSDLSRRHPCCNQFACHSLVDISKHFPTPTSLCSFSSTLPMLCRTFFNLSSEKYTASRKKKRHQNVTVKKLCLCECAIMSRSIFTTKKEQHLLISIFVHPSAQPTCSLWPYVCFPLPRALPGPGSLPGYRRRGDYDDGASDISSTSGFSAYGYRSGIKKKRKLR